MNHQKESLPAFILLTNENLQEHLYLKAQYWLSSIVKDDVFFAPSFDMYTETIAAISTPCLPPVTPPSDLLIDHEPLFEGMVDLSTEESKRAEKRPYSSPRPQKKKMRPKSRFEQLTTQGMDWCRYCGTTEDVNWRPGPWGKRTLCKLVFIFEDQREG
ncbi:hypothetical protein G6F56_011426 [Rhizopus delemar]|nr:hypothetical protein G6F56_011426 [Rhizopus delemar]